MTLSVLVGLGINGALAVLLSVTLVFLWRLHKAMEAVRGNQGELQALLNRLNEATERAQTALHQLRAAATETADVLRLRTDAGRRVADDLEIALGAGERLVGRMEQRLNAGREPRPAAAAPADAVVTKLKGVR